MRVIKLTHGSGNGIDKACLMTASNMLIGRGAYRDDNPCVCRVVRAFIIRTNDAMPEHLLGELYGPLVWEILGTDVTPDIEIKRAFKFADWAVRKVAALRFPEFRDLPEIVDMNTARVAHAAVADDVVTFDVVRVAAVDAIDVDRVARAAAVSVNNAAINAVRAARDLSADADVWKMCPEIIREVIAIGDKRPVECVLTRDQLCDSLGG